MQRDKDSQTDEGGRAGTYRDTAVCSHRFNVFVLQNLFFFFILLFWQLHGAPIGLLSFLSKYTCFERKVDKIQMIFLWYKNMNIYNRRPRFIQ